MKTTKIPRKRYHRDRLMVAISLTRKLYVRIYLSNRMPLQRKLGVAVTILPQITRMIGILSIAFLMECGGSIADKLTDFLKRP